MYLYCASERSERAPQKHIFSGLKIHLHTMSYTVNAVSFNYLWSEASILGGGGQTYRFAPQTINLTLKYYSTFTIFNFAARSPRKILYRKCGREARQKF